MAEEPKRLIVWVEHGIGGWRAWIESNVEFDQAAVIQTTDDAVDEDVTQWDEIRDVTDQYYMSADEVRAYIKVNKERIEAIQKRREEA